MKETGYLDVIDDHYTRLVGQANYVSDDGQLDLDKLKQAILNAHNEIHGTKATSFEHIVESR